MDVVAAGASIQADDSPNGRPTCSTPVQDFEVNDSGSSSQTTGANNIPLFRLPHNASKTAWQETAPAAGEERRSNSPQQAGEFSNRVQTFQPGEARRASALKFDSAHDKAPMAINKVVPTDAAPATIDEDTGEEEGPKERKPLLRAILPNNRKFRVWWYATVLAAMLSAWLEPFIIAFEDCLGFPCVVSGLAVIEVLVQVVFVVDLVVVMMLAYVDQETGEMVTDLKRVIKYRARSLWWLLLITIPFDWIVIGAAGLTYSDSNTALYIALLRWLKVGRIYLLFELFAYIENKMVVSQIVLMLIRNYMFVFYSCHWAACIFYYIARLEAFQPTSWVGRAWERFEGESLFGRYVYSLYFSFSAFSGLGDGDFFPASVAESVFLVVYLLFNVVLSAYILGTVTMLMVKGDKRSKVFRDRMTNLKEFCANNDLPQTLHDAMREHLELHFHSEQTSDDTVLGCFPSTIKRKVLRHLYLRPVRNNYLFKGCKAKFLDAIMAAARVELFMPHVQILAEGDIVNELFIIVDGDAETTRGGATPSALAPGWMSSRGGMSFSMGRSFSHGDGSLRGGPSAHGGSHPIPPHRHSSNGLRSNSDMSMHGGSPAPGSGLGSSRGVKAGGGRVSDSGAAGMSRLGTNLSMGGGGGGRSGGGMLTSAPSFAGSTASFSLGGGREYRKRLMMGGLNCLTTSDSFGEIAYFTEVPSPESVWSRSVLRVLVLSKASLEGLAKAFPQQTRLMLENLQAMAQEGLKQQLSTSLEHANLSLAQAHDLETFLTQASGSSLADMAPELREVMREALAPEQLQQLQSLESIRSVVRQHVKKVDQMAIYNFLNAAGAGDTEAVKTMLSQGISPNSADYDNRTALMLACHEGHEEVARLLLEAGADPQAKDNFGGTAMFEAVKMNYEHMITLLLKYKASLGMDGIMVAAQMCTCVFEGDLVQLKRLLLAGADPDSADYDKRCALHISAAEGNVTAVKVMVEVGKATVDFADRWGNTALDEATRVGAKPVTDYLEPLFADRRPASPTKPPPLLRSGPAMDGPGAGGGSFRMLCRQLSNSLNRQVSLSRRRPVSPLTAPLAIAAAAAARPSSALGGGGGSRPASRGVSTPPKSSLYADGTAAPPALPNAIMPAELQMCEQRIGGVSPDPEASTSGLRASSSIVSASAVRLAASARQSFDAGGSRSPLGVGPIQGPGGWPALAPASPAGSRHARHEGSREIEPFDMEPLARTASASATANGAGSYSCAAAYPQPLSPAAQRTLSLTAAGVNGGSGRYNSHAVRLAGAAGMSPFASPRPGALSVRSATGQMSEISQSQVQVDMASSAANNSGHSSVIAQGRPLSARTRSMSLPHISQDLALPEQHTSESAHFRLPQPPLQPYDSSVHLALPMDMVPEQVEVPSVDMTLDLSTRGPGSEIEMSSPLGPRSHPSDAAVALTLPPGLPSMQGQQGSGSSRLGFPPGSPNLVAPRRRLGLLGSRPTSSSGTGAQGAGSGLGDRSAHRSPQYSPPEGQARGGLDHLPV